MDSADSSETGMQDGPKSKPEYFAIALSTVSQFPEGLALRPTYFIGNLQSENMKIGRH